MTICAECGHEHPLDELELTFRLPDVVAALQPEERETRVQENKDLCVLDGKRFFVRALLPLPVAEREHPYNVGLWVEVSQQAFERVYELWDEDRQARSQPSTPRSRMTFEATQLWQWPNDCFPRIKPRSRRKGLRGGAGQWRFIRGRARVAA